MTRILLVGCGKMGGALLSGWLDRGVPVDDVVVIDPSGVHSQVKAVSSPDDIPTHFYPDVVVLAVKPQKMAEAFTTL